MIENKSVVVGNNIIGLNIVLYFINEWKETPNITERIYVTQPNGFAISKVQ